MPIANTNVYRPCGDGTVEIVTRKGDVFIIDQEDEPIARRHCWSKHEHGYARAVTRLANGKLKTVYLHRLICEVSREQPHVDHRNGDQADCRRSNLRPCSRRENLRNQKIRADNKTGFKGVGIHKSTGLYRARARAGSVILESGLFKTPEEAAVVAQQRRQILHKEFARHD